MITRIKINGFKSLLNVDLYFGPFTCIAGANAVGKSNLFDAIVFLSKLADNTILQAAKSIRSEDQKHSNIKDIFFKSGSHYLDKMSFEIDMIVPAKAEGELGQPVEATITSLRYTLELILNENNGQNEPIGITRESLYPIAVTEMKNRLYFETKKEWSDSVLTGQRDHPFISTENGKIKMHRDGETGSVSEFIAEKMPRTLLSTVTSGSPTAYLVRQEMCNWVKLQFDPAALRQPDSIFETKNAQINSAGFHLPATLYRLHHEKGNRDVYQSLTNRLKEVADDADEIYVEKDEKRGLLTLQMKFGDGSVLPAQSLSDGTLRFLGLACIMEDNGYGRIICLEEPENGINPQKIDALVQLLEESATDTEFPVDEDNPLRQVMINTHSPVVVNSVPGESLYLAAEKEIFLEEFGKKVNYTGFMAVDHLWKTKHKLAEAIPWGDIAGYLEKSVFEKMNTPKANDEKKITVAEHYRQSSPF